MTSHDEMLDNVAVYALGVLPPGEAQEVAEHLRTCEECRREYDLLRPVVSAVGSSAQYYGDEVCPGPLLKARILREVRNSGRAQSPAKSGSPWLTFGAIAASLVFTVGALLIYTTMDRRIARETALMAAQSAALADLASADARRYRFANGAVFVRGTHLYVALPSLAPLPPGKVYQAWTLPKGSKTMAPSVTFMPSDREETIVRLPQSAETVAAVAVSVEPEGGSKQPTSKPIGIATL
ncbi:MAG: anti-sigma factor [Candidatus Cybelea sp.]